jgi:hypothetical protein
MTLPNLGDWVRFHQTFKADPNKKVVGVEFQVEAKDAVSSTNGVDRVPIYFTDIQFQAGNTLSGWIPNTKEMLDRLTWTHDEWQQVASPYRFEGSSPQIYQNVERRWFNIVGRGHRTIVIPNYYPEDWDVPILPTGIDLTLYPKDDFDLLRISTSAGAVLPEEEQIYKKEGGIYHEIKAKYEDVISFVPDPTDYKAIDRRNQEISNFENIIQPLLDNHPLHTRYTREFWVDGAAAGTEIKVHATTRTATVNGSEVKIVGERELDVNGLQFKIDRKKFMLAPQGSATIRIEFYKQKERTITTFDQNTNYKWVKVNKKFKYLEDAGIGYYGTAGFYQWTYGKSRI